MDQSKTQMEKKASLPGAIKNNPWFYMGLMLVLVGLVFAGFLFSGSMLYCSDQLGGLDSRVFFKHSVLEHFQFPFWLNPRLGGMPTIDALFGDAFYPPSFLMNVLLPIHKAIGLKMVLHVFLAGLFFFLMLRKGFKTTPSLAFMGAVLYMFNPEFLSHVYPGHDGKMYVIALLPLIVWRLKALADMPTFLNATLFGLGIGLSLLTSHIQMTYFALWGVFFYAVFSIVQRLLRKENKTAGLFGAYFCLSIVIGIAIGFIQLYPSLMYVREAFSVRGVDRGFEHAASWSLHWPEFFSLWIPEFGNTLEYYWGGNPFKLNSEYAGGIVLLLSLVAVFWKPKPWRWFWFGVAAFAVLYSMGAHTPVFHIAYAIVPGVKKFRACSMIMFWFSFSAVLLSVLFLKDIVVGKLSGLPEAEKRKRTRSMVILMGIITGITLLFSMQGVLGSVLPFIGELDTQKKQVFEANFGRNFVPMLWLWLFFALTTIGLIIAVVQGKIKGQTVAWIIVVFGFIDVMRVNMQFIKVVDPRPYFYTEPALQKLKEEMAVSPFRCFSLPGVFSQNGEGVHGLEGVSGFHDNELRWYREFRGNQQDQNYFDRILGFGPNGDAFLKAEQIDQGNAFLNIANARYLLLRNGSELLTLENKNALGRVSFAPGYVVKDSAAIVPALLNDGYNYRTTVALLSEPAERPATLLPDSVAAKLPPLVTQWKKYSPNVRVVKVTAPVDGFLRISEVFYPGWQLLLDGKVVPYYRSDLSWMAMYLPKGEHEVTMKVQSLFLKKAVWVTFPAVIMVVVVWFTAFFFARKKNAD